MLLIAACASAQGPGEQLDIQVAALQAQVAALESQAHDLPQTQLDALQAQIDSLTAQIAALQAQLNDHETRLVALEGTTTSPVCGDNAIDPGEVCDGTALGGESCVSQGFDSGVLACAADCLSFDTSACVTNPPPPGGIYDALAAFVPPPGEFALIPNTDPTAVFEVPGASGSHNVWLAWNGMAFDHANGHWYAHGGGHGDYAGNEIYRFRFQDMTWERLTNQSPRTGPEFAPGCNRPLDGPVVGHTYDGSVWVPSKNTLMTTGYILSCLNGDSDGIWTWDGTWSQLAGTELPSTSPLHPQTLSKTAYDAARDRVYLVGLLGSDPSSGVYEINPTDWSITLLVSNVSSFDQGVALFDPTRRVLYFTVRNLGTRAVPIALDGTPGAVTTVSTTGAAAGDQHIALHSSGDIVFWNGGDGIKRLDPDTGATTTLIATGGPTSADSRIQSKWVYIPEVDAFVGIKDVRNGIWIYRLPGSTAFDLRCQDPNVVYCNAFDTLTADSWWGNPEGIEAGDGGGPDIDNGALRFTIPSQSDSSGAGLFMASFTPFGPGDSFSVEYKWKADCAFIYESGCSGPRRGYAAIGGGKTTAKLSIVGEEGLFTSSCTNLEIVGFHGPDHYLTGYHSCAWFAGFDEEIGIRWGQAQLNYQPNSAFDCWRMPDVENSDAKRDWGFTGPNCYYLPADQWITVRYDITIGQWWTLEATIPDSNVKMWVDGMLLLDHDLFLAPPDTPGNGYGKVWLLPYMTSKDPAEAHPVAHVWYDELIVMRV